MQRYLGIDMGAETIKVVEVLRDGDEIRRGRSVIAEHHKSPESTLRELLADFDWATVASAAATGRGSRSLTVERVPTQAALAHGIEHAHPDFCPGTLVTIGSHGFAVLELRSHEHQVYRENSRCSQGTGNFLRQLVERFDMTVEEASAITEDVEDAAVLSGRCPVILKTDMTHLANKGENQARILAGLYDAVCENVQVIVKPRICPPKLMLAGGVARSARVREGFSTFCSRNEMTFVDTDAEDNLFLEALGAATIASEHASHVVRPSNLDELFSGDTATHFEHLPPLSSALSKVRRMEAAPIAGLGPDDEPEDLVLGFDIGSTGSKLVAVRRSDNETLWKGYRNTLGNPVAAAQALARTFLEETGGEHRVRLVGATGSGREIVGSLMSACFGSDPVFVLNEIAAHARGATSFDPKVDTIFEIGGQDAKYIRLDAGRVVDAAMNEACSAGTGSFIEEQGNRFEQVRDVVQMGKLALEAPYGVPLGQHCSVFMAEVIDEAVSSGVPSTSILAGIYDSIIQNYLNRVKGNRTVGRRIFCQGMPFASDALAAAVARQTKREVVIPPDPGLVGAVGIALLATDESGSVEVDPLDLEMFLAANVDKKDTFVCTSTKGCGGAGNRCRVDRLYVTVAGKPKKFVWGGNCSLWDRGTRTKKLPDLSPDPFRERDALIAKLLDELDVRPGAPVPKGLEHAPVLALSEEFVLKGLLPFFATFFRTLGVRLAVYDGHEHSDLKRGIEEATVPFCAPMQLYQGVVARALEDKPDYFFAPRLRDLPRQKNEQHATTCPIVQGSPDILARLYERHSKTQFIETHVDIGTEGLDSTRFRTSTQMVADALGIPDGWRHAYDTGLQAQYAFDESCGEIGRRALDFAQKQNVTPVVVLGRAYTIYNGILNSNVPTLLREQGALAIPVDCYPIPEDTPIFRDMYWGYGQINLRAAHDIRRRDGVYAVYCSNYACGPDSFNLHFFSYVMEDKPFSIIETDGHSGDAGTKTRLEAFLYCVQGHRRDGRVVKPNNLKAIEADKISMRDAARREEVMLIPRMGPIAEVMAGTFRALEWPAEYLPMPQESTLQLGQRYTSGKECLPMILTLGSLLERLERERDTENRFAFFMPTACGPCRFGVYNTLHKIVLEKLGWKDRVRIVAPDDQDYFAGTPKELRLRVLAGIVASDLLLAGLHDARPVEKTPGAAQDIYDRYFTQLNAIAEMPADMGLINSLGDLPNGMFGIRNVVKNAAREYAAIKDNSRKLPTVSVVGEIYVRLDPFANGNVVEELEARGIRAVLAPMDEWMEYTTYTEMQRIHEGRGLPGDSLGTARITYALEIGIIESLYEDAAKILGWPARTSVEDTLAASAPYIDKELMGEAPLTVGGPLHEYLHGHIDGVLSVGPHECMPNKVAEAQFAHVREDHGLISLTLAINGDPIDPELLDRFAFEVHEHFERRRNQPSKPALPKALNPLGLPRNPNAVMWTMQSRALIKAMRLLKPLS